MRPHVKTASEKSEEFSIKGGVHQGSVLTLILFIIAMDKETRDARMGVPWEIVWSDDIVLMAESEEEVLKAFERTTLYSHKDGL